MEDGELGRMLEGATGTNERSPVPSALIMPKAGGEVEFSGAKRMPCPLGSQVGSRPLVRKRGLDPSAFMSQMASGPWRRLTNAIRDESGDQTGDSFVAVEKLRRPRLRHRSSFARRLPQDADSRCISFRGAGHDNATLGLASASVVTRSLKSRFETVWISDFLPRLE